MVNGVKLIKNNFNVKIGFTFFVPALVSQIVLIRFVTIEYPMPGNASRNACSLASGGASCPM